MRISITIEETLISYNEKEYDILRMEGKLHRANEPVRDTNWYQYGKKHRHGGPAVKHSNMYQVWKLMGLDHHINAPAIKFINNDGKKSEEWRVEGKKHRIGGPAIEHTNGEKEWYQNDVRHRVDGPAREEADGTMEYWLNGVKQS